MPTQSSYASRLPTELLVHIVAFLPQSSLAAAAVTCQAWKDPALDRLWRVVNLKGLLRVLAPMQVLEDGTGDLVSMFLKRIAVVEHCKSDSKWA